MRPVATLACVLSVFLAGAQAQQTPAPRAIPSIAEIRSLLGSTTPADQAWGCWWAAQAQARELAPVIERVATANATKQGLASSVTVAGLDALVQLGATASVAFAESMFARQPVESLILLSRAGADADPVLLRIVAREKELRWLTALYLAAPRKPAGLVAALLQQIHIVVDVGVSSPGDQVSLSSTGVFGGSAADGASARLPGFPPQATYTLATYATGGAAVLAKGPRTIYYSRVLSRAGESGSGNWHDETFGKTHEIFAVIATMLAPGREVPIRAIEPLNVVWTDQAALDHAIDDARTDIAARFQQFLRVLVTSRLLTEDEASRATQPLITAAITDRRRDAMQPPVTRIADRASATLTIPGSADFLAGDTEGVWITNRGRMEKLQHDKPAPVATVPMPRPCGVPALTQDSVWVANCSDQSLYRIDRKTNTVVATIPTGLADRSGELSVAASSGAIWLLTDAAGVLSRIDPKTNTVVARIEVAPNSYAAAYDINSDSVWISTTGARGATGPGGLQRVEPATNKVVATIAVGPRPRFLAAGEGGIWTLNQGDGTVSRVDPKTNQVVATIDAGVPGGGGDIAAGNGRVWVRATKTLLQAIDPQTNRIVEIFGPPAGSGAVRVAGNFVWVSAHDIQKVWVLR